MIEAAVPDARFSLLCSKAPALLFQKPGIPIA